MADLFNKAPSASASSSAHRQLHKKHKMRSSSSSGTSKNNSKNTSKSQKRDTQDNPNNQDDLSNQYDQDRSKYPKKTVALLDAASTLAALGGTSPASSPRSSHDDVDDEKEDVNGLASNSHPIWRTVSSLSGSNQSSSSDNERRSDGRSSSSPSAFRPSSSSAVTVVTNSTQRNNHNTSKALPITPKERHIPAHKKKSCALTFPEKLMAMLDYAEETKAALVTQAKNDGTVYDPETYCITWLPQGNAFLVRDPTECTNSVIPMFFKAAKFNSFTRKLYRWGFHQVERDDATTPTLTPDAVIFASEHFHRDARHEMAKMRSMTSASQKRKIEAISMSNFLNAGNYNVAGVAGVAEVSELGESSSNTGTGSDNGSLENDGTTTNGSNTSSSNGGVDTATATTAATRTSSTSILNQNTGTATTSTQENQRRIMSILMGNNTASLSSSSMAAKRARFNTDGFTNSAASSEMSDSPISSGGGNTVTFPSSMMNHPELNGGMNRATSSSSTSFSAQSNPTQQALDMLLKNSSIDPKIIASLLQTSRTAVPPPPSQASMMVPSSSSSFPAAFGNGGTNYSGNASMGAPPQQPPAAAAAFNPNMLPQQMMTSVFPGGSAGSQPSMLANPALQQLLESLMSNKPAPSNGAGVNISQQAAVNPPPHTSNTYAMANLLSMANQAPSLINAPVSSISQQAGVQQMQQLMMNQGKSIVNTGMPSMNMKNFAQNFAPAPLNHQMNMASQLSQSGASSAQQVLASHMASSSAMASQTTTRPQTVQQGQTSQPNTSTSGQASAPPTNDLSLLLGPLLSSVAEQQQKDQLIKMFRSAAESLERDKAPTKEQQIQNMLNMLLKPPPRNNSSGSDASRNQHHPQLSHAPNQQVNLFQGLHFQNNGGMLTSNPVASPFEPPSNNMVTATFTQVNNQHQHNQQQQQQQPQQPHGHQLMSILNNLMGTSGNASFAAPSANRMPVPLAPMTTNSSNTSNNVNTDGERISQV